MAQSLSLVMNPYVNGQLEVCAIYSETTVTCFLINTSWSHGPLFCHGLKGHDGSSRLDWAN